MPVDRVVLVEGPGDGPGDLGRWRRCRRRPRGRRGPGGRRRRARGRRARGRPPRGGARRGARHAVGGRHRHHHLLSGLSTDRATAWAEAHAVPELERSKWAGSIPALTPTSLSVNGRSVAAGHVATRSGSSSEAGRLPSGRWRQRTVIGVLGRASPRRRRPGAPTGAGRSRPWPPRRPRRSWPTSTVRSSRRRWRRPAVAPGRRRAASATAVGDLGHRHRGLLARCRGGRCVTWPSARSRGPTSTRTGTPLSSQSVARRPKLVATWASSCTRTPAGRELGDELGRPPSPAPSSSRTSSTTAWMGARRGRHDAARRRRRGP